MVSLLARNFSVRTDNLDKAKDASSFHTTDYSESEYSSSTLSISSGPLETDSESESSSSIKAAELEFEELQFLQSISRTILKRVRGAAQIGLEEELAIFKDPTCSLPPSAQILEQVTSSTIEMVGMSAPAVVFALVYFHRALHDCIDGKAPGCVAKNLWQGCLLLSAKLYDQSKHGGKSVVNRPLVAKRHDGVEYATQDVNSKFVLATLGLLKGQVGASGKEFKEMVGKLIDLSDGVEATDDKAGLKKVVGKEGAEARNGRLHFQGLRTSLARFRWTGRRRGAA